MIRQLSGVVPVKRMRTNADRYLASLEESYNQIKRRTLPPMFDRAGSDWLEAEKPHLAELTYEIYEVAYRCHLKPILGSLLLCDINASKIASYQAKRKTERASAYFDQS